jgi:cell division protease FtsH
VPNRARTVIVWLALSAVFLVLLLSFDGEEVLGGPATRGFLVGMLPFLVLVGLLIWFVRKQGQGQAGANWMDLKRSRARKVEKAGVSFADVGGLAEAKERLRDVVDFLRNPQRWQSAGVRLPRGVLLEGPAGSGKTLLARAVAGEAGVSVFEVSASEFVEKIGRAHV